ncbi:ribosomal L7Ae/L30e/S12e/Gadd45 family protein [Candidatus Woesearchaeota archaeon]|nr:ribosomal L7Ae/L30e/S12e/Gadd45 family protein [Candidatus Woesearchaeota archaeon]
MDATSDIKKLLGSDRLIIGAEKTLKALRQGALEKAFVATNPKESIKRDLDRYATTNSVPIVDTGLPNDELGTLCKKPFPISVIGLRKA